MSWFKPDQNKALLGQLLVKQKLISEEQLARAIELQRTTGQRLGDIFAEWNLVTHQHVQDALRKQRHLRLAAAIVTALVAPLESYAAAAVPAVAVTAPVVLRSDSGQASGDGPAAANVAAIGTPPAAAPALGGLKPMSEDELSDTSAQGLHDELVQHVQKQMKDKGLDVIGDMAKVLNPVLSFLDSDVTMKNVVYDPTKTTATLGKDGTLTLALPTSIGEIRFDNIRVHGSQGPSFGSISIKGIDLTGTVISLAFNKH
ncbi:hypothetical protein GCM10027277_55810 [Pseudoduganella ginsengisoli]|uniref:Uncharacterized protein n=1 Tax=Pseudoduganella ginsengisoli TaxID=1462440 RepID=A0A6L6Q5J2_9BURK|nr:hypothetical protein [Pseudoduganella ginsengisoli]MTW05017.1 hypothetical protein [Pseudoduganella ginsengisoli]